MENEDPVLTRFYLLTKRDLETGCLMWQGATKGSGYGAFRYENVSYRAHRFIYEYVKNNNERLPNNIVVRHTCDTPLCVDLNHLLPGTHKDNYQDCVDRGRAAFQKKEKVG